MTTSTNLPVSEILRSKNSTDDEPKKKSREDWRKAKELEEARKAGTAPAAVDEEGKDINPHIPQYISAAPWYFGCSGPTLKHQRFLPEEKKELTRIDVLHKRGINFASQSIKFRKGSCENCGAMTHKKKDCMERPRKIGAKYTGAKLAPDEFIQPELDRDFDGKRDRWAGYDPSQHQAIVEHYHKIEEAKRQLRADKLNADQEEGETKEEDDEEDEDKYVDEVDMPGTKVDSKQRITVRNLRIREDTAKYLRNLDPSSAYYDPKTRSMRDNPHEGTAKQPEAELDVDYAGENFVRFTGDTRKHARAQVFAWEAYEKGVDVHLLAEPTKLQMLQKEYEEKKEEFKKRGQDDVLERYGGAEHLDAPPKQLLLAQTEDYTEYSRYGKLIKGQEKSVVRSKYEEDVFLQNHTTVWGSFWHLGRWGYKCCHSFIKESYCTGEAGKAAASDLMPLLHHTQPKEESTTSDSSTDSESEKKAEKKKMKNKKKKIKEKKKREKKKHDETAGDKLKTALLEEDRKREEAETLLKMDERKRPYNSMFQVKKPTEEEMEAYYIKKRRDEDPMAQFQETV